MGGKSGTEMYGKESKSCMAQQKTGSCDGPWSSTFWEELVHKKWKKLKRSRDRSKLLLTKKEKNDNESLSFLSDKSVGKASDIE